jgi:hypothetical protein
MFLGPLAVFMRKLQRSLLSAIGLTILFLAAATGFASDCLPIGEAGQHVGENKCIVGKVVKVKVAGRGVHVLGFCADPSACPFSVVVFPRDLKDVGDIRRLEGRVIEIHGPVKLYDGRAEIILNRISQLTGGSTLLPPLPKNYDVEKEGHYSAGRMRPPKKLKKSKSSVTTTSIYGNDVEGEDPP